MSTPLHRYPGIDPSDFFNYGLNERTWREYCGRVARYRLEFTMQASEGAGVQGRGSADCLLLTLLCWPIVLTLAVVAGAALLSA